MEYNGGLWSIPTKSAVYIYVYFNYSVINY